MLFDLNENKEVNETYKLMAQTIIPRPIAWVVTEDEGVVKSHLFLTLLDSLQILLQYLSQ